MFISAPGCVFMFYLAVLVSISSETVYTVPKNTFQSAVALFMATFVTPQINYEKRSMQVSLV